jgi:type I restriction enzyme S subunit
MDKYQSYRYSGIKEIGDVPTDWIVTKFNRYVYFQEGPGLRTFQFTDEGTKVICVTNITEKGIDFTYQKFISNEEYLEKYQHFTVQKGDLLLSSSGNSWGKVSEYLDDEKVMLNTSTIRLNTLNNSRMNKGFIKHILKSELVRRQLDILMTGSCQPNFGPSHLNQLIIPVPTINEQNQIVQFLDEKIDLIDKLISTKERKISLLKEQRTSLINLVITKGLSPNVKMKDSGIEWIGEVPENWIISKIKHNIGIRTGYSFKSEEFVDDSYQNEKVPVIRISNIQDGYIDLNGSVYLPLNYTEKFREFNLVKGDILICLTGSLTGKVGVFEHDLGLLNQRVGKFYFKNESKVIKKYFSYFIKQDLVQKLIKQMGEGISENFPNVSHLDVIEMNFTIPSIEEQNQIVDHLDVNTGEIDNLIQLEQRKIDLLKEYRQSLISEVVTGKIKVTTD